MARLRWRMVLSASLLLFNCNEPPRAAGGHQAERLPRDLAAASQANGTAALTSTSSHREDISVEAIHQRPHSPLTFLRLTLGGADSREPLPWVVAFHGLGDTPRAFGQLFVGLPVRAHVYLARAPIPAGSGYDWFGTRVLGDDERLALRIEQRLPDVAALLDELAEQPQNVGDAVVTGFSQGGILSFAIAVAGLAHVRAALPIAGWLPPRLSGAKPVIPVLAFHGHEDAVVPFEGTQRMIDVWLRSDVSPTPVVLHAYPGLMHRINPELRADWAAELGKLLR